MSAICYISVRGICTSPSESGPPPLSGVGRGPRVVVSTAAFHARARGSFPCLGGLNEIEMFFPIHS